MKTPPQPFTISNFLLHYHFALSFLIHRNPAIPTITATLHYPSPRTIKNRNSRHRRNHNSSFFIFHFSLSSPPTPPFPPSLPICPPPRPALSKIEIRAIGATTILHFSFFIFHYLRRQPRHSHHHCQSALPLAPHYQKSKFAPSAQPQFFIFHSSFFILHSSFFKAPPFPLSPSSLSAPSSHFLTASYCCRVYHSPTAYSLSFSCRPLSSPRFS